MSKKELEQYLSPYSLEVLRAVLAIAPKLLYMAPEEIAEWLSSEEGAEALEKIPLSDTSPVLRKFADVVPAQPADFA